MNHVPCKHWSEGDGSHTGRHRCAIGIGNGRPLRSFCMRHCTAYDGPSRGMGDTAKKIITAASLGLVKPCGGCKERQTRLNQSWPAAWTQEQRNG